MSVKIGHYSILDETGNVKEIVGATVGDFRVDVCVARPEYLLENMKSFFISFYKRGHKRNNGYIYMLEMK